MNGKFTMFDVRRLTLSWYLYNFVWTSRILHVILQVILSRDWSDAVQSREVTWLG